MAKFLLDTQILVDLFSGKISVQKQLAEIDNVFIPSIVLGELYFAVHQTPRVKDNLGRISEFARSVVTLPCDAETAKYYGTLKDILARTNRELSENDLWIAALAQQHGLVLATRDPHFEKIPGLYVQLW